MSKKNKITLAILFCAFIIWSLLTKFIGIKSFFLEILLLLLAPNIFILLPFITAFFEKNKHKKIYFVLVGIVFAYVLVAVVKIPQIMITRFYYQVQNHVALNKISENDVSYIKVGDVIFDKQTQIEPIVKTLNNSTWYSPNHESRSKEIPMEIFLKTGQKIYFHISQFNGEDSADILFIRPHESGFWADGNAYVPKLPSTLENLGYLLVP